VFVHGELTAQDREKSKQNRCAGCVLRWFSQESATQSSNGIDLVKKIRLGTDFWPIGRIFGPLKDTAEDLFTPNHPTGIEPSLF
jgi:hypothetical protein